MMRAPLVFSLILAIGQSGAAASSPSPPVFSVHDRDRDGYLSADEFSDLRAQCAERRGRRCANVLRTFAELDADGDGRIGEEELLHGLGHRHQGWRQR